ncbi:pyrroline-5-carboxylate reductase [Bacillus suaedae]|uniref:Pyrroline-5-carboxylate reductase n=1 Tax=Halalkalibacter suaedae TaxID=2822140 RepID=A0A940WSW9_9BACI|nr:pyrroline-5-carboxylate reductase [Bacillus suaedae]MBP3951173.1 pyrroline-5-carboxylate reductase [Bacillus suaedae]
MSSLLNEQTITFLGAGSMAEAIIAGLVSKKIVKPEQIIATNFSNHAKLESLKQTYGIRTMSDRGAAVKAADIVILAMKPKQVKEAISDIRIFTNPSQLFVSVLAGISTSYIENLLGHEAGVIRTMPNTSAKVGASATALSKGTTSSNIQIAQVSELFEAVGTVTVVAEEKLDAVTGLAGSGPAYFYFLVEAMEDAAIESGLSHEEASALITQTILGVGKRLESTTKTARELYQEVMSPNGTTEAGINVLREHDGQGIMKKAVNRAITRSKELGIEFNS